MGEVTSSPAGSWEIHTRRPSPALDPWVLDFCDYTEHIRHSTPRIEQAAPLVPVIINLGPPFRLGSAETEGTLHGSFAAGLYDGPVISESTGASRCIQINLTPLGAGRLLGIPLGQLARQVVALEDLLGPVSAEIAERLEELPSPDQRFDLLDALLLARIGRTPAPSREIVWAWNALESSGGRRDIGSLGAELGWSRKRLIGRFNEVFGLPPKALARMIRFDRVSAIVRKEPAASWSETAQRCGYFDQAHLIRDCRQFTGLTPEAWKARF